VDPQGYLEFLSLTSGARLLLTDSGGLQEEACALGVPCLTLRENTERPVTVTGGTNEVVGTDEAAWTPLRALAVRAEPRCSPLWDGRGERAADAILAFREANGERARVRGADRPAHDLDLRTGPVGRGLVRSIARGSVDTRPVPTTPLAGTSTHVGSARQPVRDT
jgi:hypothetical protein